MNSKKIIGFPVLALAAIALFLPMGGIHAQFPSQGHLDQFNASCETQWNGNSWESCQTQPVAAPSSFDATFCVTAPFCNYQGGCIKGHPHYPDSRSGELKRPDLYDNIAHLGCPGSPEEQPPYTCPECCMTYHWTAQQGVSYYVRAENHTTSLACGPTKAKFASRAQMPECVYW